MQRQPGGIAFEFAVRGLRRRSGPVIRDRCRHHQNVTLREMQPQQRFKVCRGLKPMDLYTRIGTCSWRRPQQERDLPTRRHGSLGKGDAHPARRAVPDEPHPVDRLVCRPGGDEKPTAARGVRDVGRT